jgi:hypothetical protein
MGMHPERDKTLATPCTPIELKSAPRSFQSSFLWMGEEFLHMANQHPSGNPQPKKRGRPPKAQNLQEPQPQQEQQP